MIKEKGPLLFLEPTMAYKEQVLAYRKAFKEGNEPLYGGSKLSKLDRYEDWLAYLEENKWVSREEKERRVPQTVYVVIDPNDKTVVGLLHCRWGTNQRIVTIGGHFGYSVHPKRRKEGIGSEIVSFALSKYREKGYNDVFVTCMASNMASQALISRSGGILEEKVNTVLFHEPVYRYRIVLKENERF